MIKKMTTTLVAITTVFAMTTTCLASTEVREPVYDASGNLLYTKVSVIGTSEEDAVRDYYEKRVHQAGADHDAVNLAFNMMMGFGGLYNSKMYWLPDDSLILWDWYAKQKLKGGVTGPEVARQYIKTHDPVGYSVLYPNG